MGSPSRQPLASPSLFKPNAAPSVLKGPLAVASAPVSVPLSVRSVPPVVNPQIGAGSSSRASSATSFRDASPSGSTASLRYPSSSGVLAAQLQNLARSTSPPQSARVAITHRRAPARYGSPRAEPTRHASPRRLVRLQSFSPRPSWPPAADKIVRLSPAPVGKDPAALTHVAAALPAGCSSSGGNTNTVSSVGTSAEVVQTGRPPVNGHSLPIGNGYRPEVRGEPWNVRVKAPKHHQRTPSQTAEDELRPMSTRTATPPVCDPTSPVPVLHSTRTWSQYGSPRSSIVEPLPTSRSLNCTSPRSPTSNGHAMMSPMSSAAPVTPRARLASDSSTSATASPISLGLLAVGTGFEEVAGPRQMLAPRQTSASLLSAASSSGVPTFGTDRTYSPMRHTSPLAGRLLTQRQVEDTRPRAASESKELCATTPRRVSFAQRAVEITPFDMSLSHQSSQESCTQSAYIGSCYAFPPQRITPENTAYLSDPEFLRRYAADCFEKFDKRRSQRVNFIDASECLWFMNEALGMTAFDPVAVEVCMKRCDMHGDEKLSKAEFQRVYRTLLFTSRHAGPEVELWEELSAIDTGPATDHYTFGSHLTCCHVVGRRCQAHRKDSKSVRAAWVIERSEIGSCHVPSEILVDDLARLKSLDHPAIQQLREYYIDASHMYLITDMAEGSDLWRLLKRRHETHKYFSEKWVRQIFVQVCEGIAYVHMKGVMHRSLALHNILLSKVDPPEPVVVDAGFAELFIPPFRPNEPKERSPDLEVSHAIRSTTPPEGYCSYKCDVWALGCCLYALLCRRSEKMNCEDWQQEGRQEASQRLLSVSPERRLQLFAAENCPPRARFPADGSISGMASNKTEEEEVFFPYPFDAPAERTFEELEKFRRQQRHGPDWNNSRGEVVVKDLMQHMLTFDETPRPTMQRVLGHNWFIESPLRSREV